MNAPRAEPKPPELKPKDFASDLEIRWCPGCGDYAILKAVQKALADLRCDPDNTVFVSGIGCAARFPYYLTTYGFHTIHGRAPAVATGVKLANPELDVWVVGGDGDLLSIGGNHLVHALRRDVDLTILLFNNEVYGLTKGQYSPTSRSGTRTPSSPRGSIDAPLHALRLALAAGARFVARGIDTQQKVLPEILKRAQQHKGAALVEILQNCIVYNDGVFEEVTGKAHQDEAQLHLEHGRPLVFGKDGCKGLAMRTDGRGLEIVRLDEDDERKARVVHHDQSDPELAMMLAALEPPMPVPIGVLFDAPGLASYEAQMRAQAEAAKAEARVRTLDELIRKAPTWMVAG